MAEEQDNPSQHPGEEMEERDNHTGQRLDDTTNSDTPALVPEDTRIFETSEASNSLDIASLAKEIRIINERFLLLIEKSEAHKDTIATESGVDTLKVTPEE